MNKIPDNQPKMIFPMARPVPEGSGEFSIPSVDQPFVLGTQVTKVGEIPRVGSKLNQQDLRGHYLVRWNINRDHYIVEPGLYALGRPAADDMVFVTANYKMSFDLLRQALGDYSAWILVLDTKGINVWCAAGKGTFGTDEMVDRIQASRLAEVVSHRRLIVPQLGAPGLAYFEVKEYSRFSVSYGPVMVDDLSAFIKNGYQATPEMRIKKFPFKERLVLVPVELLQGLQQGTWFMLFFLIFAGLFGPGSFLQALLVHGFPPVIAILAGILAGNVVTPLLLPWIPGKAFSVKGGVCGLILFVLLFAVFNVFAMGYPLMEQLSWLLLTFSLSSWLGMAFTGASTFTSLNGVRKEMLRAMPVQFVSMVAGLCLWGTALWLT